MERSVSSMTSAGRKSKPPIYKVPLRTDDVPIVLMHGMAGFNKLGSLDYFYKVPQALTTDGRRVFVTKVDPFNTAAVRAGQIAPQIDDILKQTGASQVDVIAHSQGGLDIRYLISRLGYGDRIRNVVTIATPHHGTLLADASLGWVPSLPVEARAAFNLMNWLGSQATGTKADLQGQLEGLSRRVTEGTFNPETPDDPRVKYYSYAGLTQGSPAVNDLKVDIVNPSLLAAYALLQTLEGSNDGMVSVASSKWGTFLGTLAADHLDEVGQPLGETGASFDHIEFYRALARFLDGKGPPPER